MTNVYGLINYLTLSKSNDFLNEEYTSFSSNAKIISSNIKQKNAYKEFEIDKEHLNFIVRFHIENSNKDSDYYISSRGHSYFKDNNINFCCDKICISSTKEFIENNFPIDKIS